MQAAVSDAASVNGLLPQVPVFKLGKCPARGHGLKVSVIYLRLM